jgi:hypothetical protein
MATKSNGIALITGASRGIGAVYAERLAQRGYDLILVARDQRRLEHLASRIGSATKRQVSIIAADLSQPAGVRRIEEELASNDRIRFVVNNAGIAAMGGPLSDTDPAKGDAVIDINITALTRIAAAAAAAFSKRRGGTLVNLSSALAIKVLANTSVYSGSKAYVLQFSRVLHEELKGKGVTVQVVLPGAVATDIWATNGVDVNALPKGTVMTAEDLVDAALAGLDQGELVTLPSLPDQAEWNRLDAAQGTLAQKLSLERPGARFKEAVPAL